LTCPLIGQIQLYNEDKFCVSVVKKKNKIHRSKQYIIFDTCRESKKVFNKWAWDYYNCHIYLQGKVIGCMFRKLEKNKRFVKIDPNCDDNAWGLSKEFPNWGLAK